MRFLLLSVITLLLLFLSLVYGAVEIPASAIVQILSDGAVDNPVWRIIILESRIPMAVAALLSGAALATSGLILQTAFQNPLAGPSILGVSSGASMGVAIVMLLGGSLVASISPVQYVSAILGAIIGAGVVIVSLLLLSTVLKSSAMLLIAGIMISYLASSVISMLNYFAPADGVKSFVVWGLGSFSGVTLRELPWFCLLISTILAASMLFAKPLNALLLGERYARNMGYSIRKLRNLLFAASGVLTAIVTAFCGPIGFIGLVVPHIARMIFRTSNHTVLLPATVLCGGALAMFCNILTVIPGKGGVLPLNAVTPVVGVPVILYLLTKGRKLRYFN